MTSIEENAMPRSTLGVYNDMKIESPGVSQLTKYGSASVLNATVNANWTVSEPASAITSPVSV